MAKSQQQLADEAYLRSLDTLEGRTAVPEGTFPGQIDIDGSIAGVGATQTPLEDVPQHCPGCNKWMTVESGWALLMSGWKLQCGNCAAIVTVERASWEKLRQAIAARYIR